MTPLRIGLVGCGRLAELGYVPALVRASGVELTAVADPVPERCARAAPGVARFRSTADLVAAGAADALVLATPGAAHLADALVAAQAGLPTLIEKPPAPTLRETLELARLTPQPRFAFNRRFVPELGRLRAALRTNGPVELVLEMRTRPASWRSYEAADDALLNLGPHLVDIARWVSGADVARVRGSVSDSKASLELELSGHRGRALVSCSEGRYRERLATPAGTYSTGGLLDALRVILGGSSRAHPLVPSLARQLEAFAQSVRGQPTPDLAGPADGVAVMATLEAARASATRGGGWERVEAGR